MAKLYISVDKVSNWNILFKKLFWLQKLAVLIIIGLGETFLISFNSSLPFLLNARTLI